MGLWRDVFGISKKEAWEQVAAQLHGEVHNGGMWGSDAVVARVQGFDVMLDTYTVSTGKSSTTYTRLRAPFINPAGGADRSGLRMRLFRASVFSPLAKALGRQDIEIGVPDFDRDYVIQGSDEERVRRVLADPQLRALVTAQPRIMLQVVDDEGAFQRKYGRGVDALVFSELGVIKDVPRLIGLFSLVGALLDAIHRSGAPQRQRLEVPPAELWPTFADLIDDVAGSLGGGGERVGDALEVRAPDPLGALPEPALVRVPLPELPALLTSLTLQAPLPDHASIFAVKERKLWSGLVGDRLPIGDVDVDKRLAASGVEAAAPHVARVEHALRALGDLDDVVIDAGRDRLTASVPALSATDAPRVLGALLDLWGELVRARAGV